MFASSNVYSVFCTLYTLYCAVYSVQPQTNVQTCSPHQCWMLTCIKKDRTVVLIVFWSIRVSFSCVLTCQLFVFYFFIVFFCLLLLLKGEKTKNLECFNNHASNPFSTFYLMGWHSILHMTIKFIFFQMWCEPQGCGSGMIYSGSGSEFFIFGLRIRIWIRLGF